MKSNYKELGQFIRLVDVKNKDLKVAKLLGVSITKNFISSVANTIGTDFSKYKVIKQNQFAYGPVTSRNGDKISIALLTEEECIISSSYTVFEITNTTKLNPKYLMLWFSRDEFDRYARFKSHGSVREIFDWEQLCKIELPVPPIEEQEKIVRRYKVITDRIELLQKINDNLEQQALLCYKHILNNYSTLDFIEGTVGDIGNFRRGKNITASKMEKGIIPVISAGLKPSGYHNKYNVDGTSITISASGVNAGYVKLHLENIWASDCSYCNDSQYPYYLFVLLKSMQQQITELQKGTAQPHVYANEVNNLKILYLREEPMSKLEKYLTLFYKSVNSNKLEIIKLQKLANLCLKNLVV